jgi:hypothetical protein
MIEVMCALSSIDEVAIFVQDNRPLIVVALQSSLLGILTLSGRVRRATAQNPRCTWGKMTKIGKLVYLTVS